MATMINYVAIGIVSALAIMFFWKMSKRYTMKSLVPFTVWYYTGMLFVHLGMCFMTQGDDRVTRLLGVPAPMIIFTIVVAFCGRLMLDGTLKFREEWLATR